MKFKFKNKEYFIEPNLEWWNKYWKYAAGVVVVLALSLFLFGCNSGTVNTLPIPVAFDCQGSYQGAIVLPNHEERVRAFDESRARGETNFGGGVDGGFYLEGSMNLVTDASCDMQGEFIIHGQVSKASGHVNPDGTFSGGHEGGLFQGTIKDKAIAGMIFEGGGREYIQILLQPDGKPYPSETPFIFGRLNGTVVQ